MAPEPIKFTKSLQQRISEYQDILNTHVLAAADVRKEWAYRADLTLEPSGWQALWKISRRKCDELGVPFPTVLFVMVDSIDSEALMAQVNILENPGHDIPAPQEASLVNLYPTDVQNYKLMYIHETADFLDKLRFFYDYVWQPWDIEDDDNQDWTTTHLESRLKLYHDMQSGRVAPEMVRHIQSLHLEARLLNYNIEKLESEVDDKDDIEASVFCKLMDMHGRMEQIKKEFEMHEDPQMRNLLLMKRHYNRHSLSRPLDSKANDNVFVIWPGGSVNEYIELLKGSKPHITDDAYVRSSCKLQDALDQAVPGDVVLLDSGNHDIVGLGEFEKGGSIKGISTRESVRLVPHGAGNVLLNCTGGELVMENLTIDAQQLQIALACCDAAMRLNNCHISGNIGSSTSEGLLGLHDSKLTLQECYITGFGTGIMIHARSEVSLISCKIASCHIGIMVFDGGKVSLQKCTVSDCLEFGVKVQISKQNFSSNKVGSIGLLNSVGEVAVRESSVFNNCKGDVCVIQTHMDAGYDSDSPTFSFVLSGDGNTTALTKDVPEKPAEKESEPIVAVQEKMSFPEKEEPIKPSAPVEMPCDSSTLNSLSTMREEQATLAGDYRQLV